MRRRVLLGALLAALGGLLLATLGGGGDDPPRAPAAAPAPVARTGVATLAAPDALPAPLERSVARLFLVGFPGTGPARPVRARLTAHEWGGVVLEAVNAAADARIAAMIARIRRDAARAGHEPPLVAALQAGEDRAVPGAPAPQSSAADVRMARGQAEVAGRRLRALGIDMVLAPSADVGTVGGPWDGLAFSDDAPSVGKLTAGALAGFRAAGVAAVPGHFPGEGAASGDPARGLATVGLSLEELRLRDLRPFAAVADEAPAIQLSAATYAAFDGVTPATLLPQAISLLRGSLRFKGVVMSGDLGAASLATGRPVAALAVEALAIGCDLLWVPGGADDQDAAYRAVLEAVRTGVVPRRRVAAALTRVGTLRATYVG